MSRYTRSCYEDVGLCFSRVTQGEWLKTVQQGDDAEVCCRAVVQKLIDSFAIMFAEDSRKFRRRSFNRLFLDHNKEKYFDE